MIDISNEDYINNTPVTGKSNQPPPFQLPELKPVPIDIDANTEENK